MAKQVILAVAGAGKTYHVCREVDPEKKNLLLAFTHENIKNINRELIDAYGNIPNLTSVMTFDSFVYRLFVCPYIPTIARCFSRDYYEARGITLSKPPKKNIKMMDGMYRPNPQYIKDKELEHYFNKKGRVYNEYTSKLVMRAKKGREGLINKASQTLNRFFDQVLIDEFQDFREHDYDLIIALSKSVENILLVGDYYQHSVSAVNNTGKPFVNSKKKSINYNDFVTSLKTSGFVVDETTLVKSLRCPANICDFVREKLGIEIYAKNDNEGEIVWMTSDLETVLDNDNIVKLVFEDSAKYSFRSLNWSYSKGNTYTDICVILTKDLDILSNHDFSSKNLAISTINKLYVALTRTKGNLYIVTNKRFRSVKHKYYEK